MDKRTATIIGTAAVAATALSGIALAQSDIMFVDVPQNHWARQFIEWARDNNIMTGPGGQQRVFQPTKPATRAELAAVSYRLFTRLQADIDMLSRRVVELERKLGMETQQEEQGEEESTSSPENVTVQQSSRSTPPSRLPARIIITASMTGSEEVPRVDTNGRGTANVRWTNSGLEYDITVNALSGPVTGAHFHLGGRGEEGPILREIVFDGNRARGVWRDITSEEWNNLMLGQVYVNVHTEKYPDGEIRGQLIFRR